MSSLGMMPPAEDKVETSLLTVGRRTVEVESGIG